MDILAKKKIIVKLDLFVKDYCKANNLSVKEAERRGHTLWEIDWNKLDDFSANRLRITGKKGAFLKSYHPNLLCVLDMISVLIRTDDELETLGLKPITKDDLMKVNQLYRKLYDV